jgi:K+-transporting ATPase ATPase A chain
MTAWIFPVAALALSAALAVPAGLFVARVMDRPPTRFERLFDTGPQNWKQYALSMLAFNVVMIVAAFALLALQHRLPFNPGRKGELAPSTIFHTVISFVANNSQQHYAGEVHLSYFSQIVVIVANMFLGGGVSLCALVAVVRGFRGDEHVGNFYVDLWRGVVYVLVPASLVVGLLMIAAGVPMTFRGEAPGEIARGPVAALVPVKNLASVGGGFFGANSAHPYENPNAFTNLVSVVSILLFPCAVVVTYGRMLGKMRHAAILFAVMFVILSAMTAWAVTFDDSTPNPALSSREASAEGEALKSPALPALPVDQDGVGNLEGKELRFGHGGSGTYVSATTAVGCGSVNCMHDSLNPLALLVPLAGQWLNCVFGGKGVGLINLLLIVIVTVFLTGLMVGRTPEYLNKKVEAREMKLAMLALLIHPLLILVPAALFAAAGWAKQSASNPGAHGLTQTVYEFSSAASGNGSGMEGLADTHGFVDAQKNVSEPAPCAWQWDVACGVVMLLCRFVPLIAALALAGSLSAKRATTPTVGTLRTDTVTFGVVLLCMVVVLGALAFLPAAALGPVAEHFGPIPFGS